MRSCDIWVYRWDQPGRFIISAGILTPTAPLKADTETQQMTTLSHILALNDFVLLQPI